MAGYQVERKTADPGWLHWLGRPRAVPTAKVHDVERGRPLCNQTLASTQTLDAKLCNSDQAGQRVARRVPDGREVSE